VVVDRKTINSTDPGPLAAWQGNERQEHKGSNVTASEPVPTDKASPALQQLAGWVKTASKPGALEDCTLIVPTYKRPREMAGLLRLLATFSDAPREVIVVDGSPSGEVENELLRRAEKFSLPFDLVFIRSPAGLTRQRNVGIDASSRDFVFFLDDDSVPQPGYFQAIRQVFVADHAREIGAVRGLFANVAEARLTWLWRLRFALRLVPRGEPGRYFSCGTTATWEGVRPFKDVKAVDVLTGCAMAFRRAVFERHRFSLFFSGYSQGEDLEMSRRVARDWRLVVCGEARVRHEAAEGGRPAGFRRGRMALRNHYFIWRRHVPRISVLDRVRFWLNAVLIVIHHTAGAFVHGFRPQHLSYAAGTLCAAVECWFVPPAYEEPPARREYEFSLRQVGCETFSGAEELHA
jgi:GT2 family glycosyltransferase